MESSMTWHRLEGARHALSFHRCFIYCVCDSAIWVRLDLLLKNVRGAAWGGPSVVQHKRLCSLKITGGGKWTWCVGKLTEIYRKFRVLYCTDLASVMSRESHCSKVAAGIVM